MRIRERGTHVTRVPEALRPAVHTALLLVSIFIAGTIGFLVIGGTEHSRLDAIYMATITLTTVGFEEAIHIHDQPGAELFTVLLLLFGTGTLVYFFSNLTAFRVEGTLGRVFCRKRSLSARDHDWMGRPLQPCTATGSRSSSFSPCTPRTATGSIIRAMRWCLCRRREWSSRGARTRVPRWSTPQAPRGRASGRGGCPAPARRAAAARV